MSDLVTQTADILRVNAARWRTLAFGIDRVLLARRPEPGQWSALACLGHAADTEANVFAARLRAILDGAASFPNYDPDLEGTPIDGTTDPGPLADALVAARAASLALLESVRGEDLDRSAHHSELGTVTLRQLLNEWSAHDLMHIVQAERALMQGFIEESGPWRPYFADHDVAKARV